MAKKMPEGRPFTKETAKECGHNGGTFEQMFTND